MRKILCLLLTFINVVICSSCHTSSNNTDYSKLDYEKISLNTIYQEFKSNELRAEEKYIGKYICVTAEVFGIYDGFISLHEYHYNLNGIKTGYDPAWCEIKDKSLNNQIMQLNKGDIITVKGKITSLSSTGDFEVSIDVYLIE